MLSSLICIALLESAASVASWSVRSEDRRSAVLAAGGSHYMLNATMNPNPDPPDGPQETAECLQPCDTYLQGVDKETTAVCITDERVCSPSGCGEELCQQRFNEECVDQCSEWADADHTTMNVCQNRTDGYKCSGQSTCAQGTYRCKQQEIKPCDYECSAFLTSGGKTVDQDSDLVCQTNSPPDPNNFGMCMPLPCSEKHHQSSNYKDSVLCHQAWPPCRNNCTKSSPKPNMSTVCYDDFTSACENHQHACPEHLIRCTPRHDHQNLDGGVDHNKGAGPVGGLGAQTLPKCAEPCDNYEKGVDQYSNAVCIDNFRTCAPAGCGEGLCEQIFHDECGDKCSEWQGVHHLTLNVCQDLTDPWKCSGHPECPIGTYKCKQQTIEQCSIDCAGYLFSGDEKVDQNTKLVCQAARPPDESNWGTCMPLPCSAEKHNSANYIDSVICVQAHPQCRNDCATGSVRPNSSTVCYDESTELCSNHLICPDKLVRCIPRKDHQDVKAIDKKDDAGWDKGPTVDNPHGTLIEASGQEMQSKLTWDPDLKFLVSKTTKQESSI